jgi:hypothetical protein
MGGSGSVRPMTRDRTLVEDCDSIDIVPTKAIEELWLLLYENFTRNAYRKEI